MESKTADLLIILGITVLNAIGMTIVLPLFPFLLGEYVPAAKVAVALSGLVSVFAICQFFAAPVFGALSDRFGRKPILLASLLGSAVGYVLLGIGGALWVLFLGRIIDGLTAGNQSALFAYISDTTGPRERGKWFGYLGGAIGQGLLFLSAYVHRAGMIIAAVACIVLGEGLFDPSYNARLSLSVGESRQGQLQGANRSLQALYHVIVPLGAAAVYTFDHSAVFAMAGILMGCGLICFVRLE